jgi:hypothetical protein
MDDAPHDPLAALVDDGDRRYVESLEAGPGRETVIASLAKHRVQESLRAGDPLPELSVLRAEGLDAVRLGELVGSRPLLLVFGSFT